MARKKIAENGEPTKQRASWKGALTIGLVTFPVEAHNIIDPQGADIRFRQLHAICHNRIQHKKVCPIHGEVSNEEIVSGYEYELGKYVELLPEELDGLRTERDRALRIDAFVSPDAIDLRYFDGRMYYLTPSGLASQEPFTVIVEAMEREGRYGVGQVFFSGKDQLALVRPLKGILHLAMLNYDTEIRPPRMVASATQKPRMNARYVRLAQALIEDWSEDHFDISRYYDSYRDSVAELIETKRAGRVVKRRTQESSEVLSLVEALKQSLQTRDKQKKHPARRSA